VSLQLPPDPPRPVHVVRAELVAEDVDRRAAARDAARRKRLAHVLYIGALVAGLLLFAALLVAAACFGFPV